MYAKPKLLLIAVSTHSRPKAAARFFVHFPRRRSFNTQPPEGGWKKSVCRNTVTAVSTHSRPKAADGYKATLRHGCSFNTQPPEGGCRVSKRDRYSSSVSTHSRPKAAVLGGYLSSLSRSVSTHSRPKAAAIACQNSSMEMLFQHTAARRRLMFSVLKST